MITNNFSVYLAMAKMETTLKKGKVIQPSAEGICGGLKGYS